MNYFRLGVFVGIPGDEVEDRGYQTCIFVVVPLDIVGVNNTASEIDIDQPSKVL